MLMTLAFDFAKMKLNYESTNQWPTLCLESRHHIKRSDSQASYANAPGSRLDRGQRVYDHSSVPYRRPCLGNTSLIIQEISSAALSPHHERFCPTRDLCYIPTPDAFHYGSGVGPPVTLHCGKLWDTRRRHLKLGLAAGLPLDADTHT